MKLKTYNRKIDKFLKDLDYLCQENAIQIVFTNRNYVKCDGIKCTGYFDEDKRELVCALKMANPAWLATLVHESCHLDQWREKDDIYVQFDNSLAGQDGIVDVWLLKQKEFDSTIIHDAITVTKKMEWDNEKRSIEKIKKYKLPIDLDKYTKQAIIYIMFHDFMEKYRVWYKPGQPPSRRKDVYGLVPDNYDLSILPQITPEIEEKMKKYIL